MGERKTKTGTVERVIGPGENKTKGETRKTTGRADKRLGGIMHGGGRSLFTSTICFKETRRGRCKG